MKAKRAMENKANGSIKIFLQKLEVEPNKNKVLMRFYIIRCINPFATLSNLDKCL